MLESDAEGCVEEQIRRAISSVLGLGIVIFQGERGVALRNQPQNFPAWIIMGNHFYQMIQSRGGQAGKGVFHQGRGLNADGLAGQYQFRAKKGSRVIITASHPH